MPLMRAGAQNYLIRPEYLFKFVESIAGGKFYFVRGIDNIDIIPGHSWPSIRGRGSKVLWMPAALSGPTPTLYY